MTVSLKNEWLSELLAGKRDLIADYWIEDIRREGILAYQSITDEQLRADLPPTVDSMISAFETGDTEGPRRHSVGVIQRRLIDGFLLPDLQASLHALETTVMRIVKEAKVDPTTEFDALQSASNAYYLVAQIAAAVYEEMRTEQQRRFSAAYDLGLTLGETLDLDLVLDTSARKLNEDLGTSSTVLLLAKPGDEPDEVRASCQLDTEVLEVIPDICEVLRCDIAALNHSKMYKSVIAVPDVRTYGMLDRWAGLLTSHGCISVLYAPLMSKKERLGSVILFRQDIHHASESEKAFLLALTNHVASAVRNALLYEQAQGKFELGVLLEASRLFSSSLDTQDILNKLSNIATRAVKADVAVVMVVDPLHKQKHQIGYYAKYGDAEQAAKQILSALTPEVGNGVALLQKDFADKAAMLYSDPGEIPDGLKFLAGTTQSGIIIPIRYKDISLGVFVLATLERNTVSGTDISLAEGLSDIATVAIENARLYEYQKNIAETLQRSFLPSEIPAIEGYETAVYYKPALVEAEVGGDFYDIFCVADRNAGIVIGDVSGKGLRAAVSTAMGKYMIRAYAAEDPSPASVLTRFNRTFYEMVPEFSFITAFYAMLDPNTNTLVYESAGHDPPLLYSSASHEISRVKTGGLCLGITDKATYVEKSIHFEPGDVLLLYTDGATDVKEDGNRLDITGLRQVLSDHAEETAEQIVNGIAEAILEFGHGRLADDVALVVVKRCKPAEAIC